MEADSAPETSRIFKKIRGRMKSKKEGDYVGESYNNFSPVDGLGFVSLYGRMYLQADGLRKLSL